MSQFQELQAIDRFVNNYKINNEECKRLIADWKNWYPKLSWYEKNMSPTILSHARAFRTALEKAGNPKTTISSDYETEFGVDSFKKPGTQVPDPNGYRRASSKEITPTVQHFAVVALSKVNPIGKRQSTVVEGKQYLAQSEWHFDNHPKGGKGPAFWHPGISIFVPKAPIAPTHESPHYDSVMFRTATAGMPSSENNPYA